MTRPNEQDHRSELVIDAEPPAQHAARPTPRAAHSKPAFTCPEGCGPVRRDGNAFLCDRGHRWPVRHGIPRFVPQGDTYADAFGVQWNTFTRTQLDSYTGTTISRDRLRRAAGEAGWASLNDAAACPTVLEVGCGAGRFTEVLLATRARVTSVDLSSAVTANERNFPQDDRHRIAQADVMRLPFAPQQFDVVVCLGVIQHTPDPEATIAKLYEQVRPGGLLVIDHYRFTPQAYLKTAPIFRAVMRRLPPGVGLQWSKRLIQLFLPLHEATANSRIPRSLLARISPLVTYYNVLPLRLEHQREWALLDTHDALTDYYKHLRTPEQIRRTLEGLGLAEIWCQVGGNGVEARGRRPA